MSEPVESIRGVRDHLAMVVERAEREQEPTVITRRGKEVAAVVPIEILRQWQTWYEEFIKRLVEERRNSPSYPLTDVLEETLARSD